MGPWNIDRFDALLFDMDGVITDSMPYHCEAWQRIFEGLGLSVPREEILRREGEKGLATLEAVLDQQGLHLPRERLRRILEEKEEVFRSLARPRLFPGAEELVTEIHERGKRIALVTGTSRQETESNLPPRLLQTFDAVVTGDMLERGKPGPEPYLAALRLLGAEPETSLAIENAPYGIRSAKGAGLRCIAVTTSLPAPYLEEADVTVRDLAELRRLLFESP